MPKFAANLTMMFDEADFLDRFAAASNAGFEGVEYLFPYDYPAERLAGMLSEHGLTQVLHNLPAGDWDGGDRGIACDPRRVGEFQDGVRTAIEYAKALGCAQLNCLAGIVPRDVSAMAARDTFIDNLRFAAPALETEGIRLLIEPINAIDIPGFLLTRTHQARSIISEVASSNLYIQHDIYHMQIMEGDLARTIEANLDLIAHMQIADNPGRGEPGTGEINYGFLFDMIDAAGYDGWIGCEYRPKTTTEQGLGWIRGYL